MVGLLVVVVVVVVVLACRPRPFGVYAPMASVSSTAVLVAALLISRRVSCLWRRGFALVSLSANFNFDLLYDVILKCNRNFEIFRKF